jgi:hypothetical protein
MKHPAHVKASLGIWSDVPDEEQARRIAYRPRARELNFQ